MMTIDTIPFEDMKPRCRGYILATVLFSKQNNFSYGKFIFSILMASLSFFINETLPSDFIITPSTFTL